MKIYIIYHILLFLLLIILFYIINKNIIIGDSFKNFVQSSSSGNNELKGISNENVKGATPNSNGSGWNLMTTKDEVTANTPMTKTYKDKFIVPIMKSNNQNGFVASVSSSYDNNNNPAYSAFTRSTIKSKYINTKHNYDKKTGLYKGSSLAPNGGFNNIKGEWLKINFPPDNKSVVTSYTIKALKNIYRAPNTFYILALLNGKWIQLDYQKNQIFEEDELKTYKLPNNTTYYLSYCILVPIVGSPNLFKKKRDEEGRVSFAITEWNLIELKPVIIVPSNTIKEIILVPVMKSNNQDGFVASISSLLNNSYAAYMIFARSTVKKFINTKHNYNNKTGLYKGFNQPPNGGFNGIKGEWIKIDFPNDNKSIVTSYTIQCAPNIGIYRVPNTFYVLGLLNDIWIQLDYQKNQVFVANEIKNYKLNNNNISYSSYCLLVTIVGTPDLSKKPKEEEGRVSLYFKEWNLIGFLASKISIMISEEYDAPSPSCTIDDIGNICSTQDGFGIINKDCSCIAKNIEKEEEMKEDESKCNKYNSCVNDVLKQNNELLLSILNMNKAKEKIHEEIDLTGCYPNNTNFEEICKNINSNYEIGKVTKCDNNNSKVDCINMKNIQRHLNGLIMTPCLYKTEDFDTWCRYFNSNNIPEGYNINSVGTIKILNGEDGNCITNGIADPNKARAICGYNSMEGVQKLNSVNNNIGYNKFTDCFLLKDTNFKGECSNILKTDISNVKPVEIMGYDCNPNYGRAKCIYSNDEPKINSNFNLFNYKNDYDDSLNNNNNCL